VENGHPMMARVTGTGCMLSAIIGAFAAVEANPMIAATGAVAFFGLAGEKAAHEAKAPGSFKVALLDALFTLTAEDVKGGAKIKFPLPSETAKKMVACASTHKDGRLVGVLGCGSLGIMDNHPF